MTHKWFSSIVFSTNVSTLVDSNRRVFCVLDAPATVSEGRTLQSVLPNQAGRASLYTDEHDKFLKGSRA